MPRYKSVGTTGTRNGLTENQREWIEDFSRNNQIRFLHHGDCIGSDTEVATVFSIQGTCIIAHPCLTISVFRANCLANDLVFPPDTCLNRNRRIVKVSELILGFPGTEDEIIRSGTWATIRHARSLQVPIYVVTPNGKVITWNLE